MNSISFFGVCLLIALFIVGVTRLIIVPLILNRTRSKNGAVAGLAEKQNNLKTNVEKAEAGVGEVKVNKVSNKKDKTIRKPIRLGDRNYESKIQQLEIDTREFYSNLLLPEGFKEFLNKYYGKVVPACNSKTFKLEENIHMLGVDSLIKVDEIFDENINLIVFTDDYFTQFRQVLFFAYDGSGHGFYFLDYGVNAMQPPVKFLDSEQDEIYTLTDSFYEFKQKIEA